MLSALALIASIANAATYNVCGNNICDSLGRPTMFRGFNIAANGKIQPYRPLAENTSALLLPLVELGANAVRFPFFWTAFEPKRGEFDTSYLISYYEKVVDELTALGIQTIVDFHQDGYSQSALGGCGSGFPEWTLPSWYTPFVPDNSAKTCDGWGNTLAFSPRIRNVFNSFYKNEGSVRDAFLNMTSVVMQHFCDHPGVLGFDLLNEPLGDEKTQISPLHQEMVSRLRGMNCSKIAFLAPTALSSSGLPDFSLQPPSDRANIVFAPHFYNPAEHIGLPTDLNFLTNRAFENMNKHANTTFKSPFFVTEFGSSAKNKNPQFFLDSIFAKLDHYLVSATQWTYTPGWTNELKDGWNGEDFSVIDNNGNLRVGYRPRPYAQSIAGVPVKMNFDPKTTQFYFEWVASGSTTLLTEFYVPSAKNFAPSPSDWKVCPSVGVTCTSTVSNKIQCLSPVAGKAIVQFYVGNTTATC